MASLEIRGSSSEAEEASKTFFLLPLPGFLVESNNYKDLAKKIIRISKSENQLIEFGKFSMKLAQENYSVERVVDQHKQAYISLLN